MKKKVIKFMIICLCIGCFYACGQAEQDLAQATESSQKTEEASSKESSVTDVSKETETQTPENAPVVEETPEFKIADDFCGLTLGESGELGYYTDGEIDEAYVGLAEYEGAQYYIEEGAVNEDYTGIAYGESEFLYVVDGKVDATYLGTIEYNGKTFSVVDGKVDTTYVRESSELNVVDVAEEEVEYVGNAEASLSEKNTTYELNIEYPKDGLYRMLIKNIYDSNSYYYSHNLYDAFREHKGVSAGGEVYGSTRNCYDILTMEGNAQIKDILVTECADRHGYSLEPCEINYELYFMNSIVELSGETKVNDSFSEEDAFIGTGNLDEGTDATVIMYKYTPTESGEYVISFDDIEISKPLDVYSKNILFTVITEAEECGYYSDIYVHGKDAYLIADYEEGKTYTISIYVEKYNNSEKYHNGDVRFSMTIKKAKEQTDITGYTQVKDTIDYENECVVYSIVPTRKQDINFTLSSGEGTFKAEIKDESDNVIYEYPELKAGDSFVIKDTLSDYEYRVCVSGETIGDYVLDVQY